MLRKTLLLLLLPIIITLVYAASGCRSEKVRVCKVQISVPSYSKDSVSIMANSFTFYVRAGFAEFCLAGIQNPFVPSCYAFKRCYALQNDLDTSSFDLRFNHSIIAGNDTLAPGTNIFSHPAFKKYVPILGEGFNCASLGYRIGTGDSLGLKELVFETGYYNAYFSCQTTDNVKVETFATVMFR